MRLVQYFLNFLRILGMVGLAALALGLVALSVYILSFDPKKHNCGEGARTVRTIGACDSTGHCSVQFNDDTYGLVDYPAIGKTYTGCEVNNDPHN